MLLIRLFSRTFVTIKTDNNNKYKTIVIKEIPKHLKENDIIELDSSKYINIDNDIDNSKIIKVKLVKLIVKKIDIIRSKRRKRFTRRVGYNQHIGYFHIIN